MRIPKPTPIFRLIHRDNLEICLQRDGLHAPNHAPDDGWSYRTIHNVEIQDVRHQRKIPCGPGGTVHDYVPFYFGPRPPMLYQLHSGQVTGYTEGQAPLLYMMSTVEEIVKHKLKFVFSDGHGIAAFTRWFDDILNLSDIDWKIVYAKYWADTIEDMDRQRRKQAEFLVHRFCPLHVLTGIGVLNSEVKQWVESTLKDSPHHAIPIHVRKNLYY